ncbi:hypothetical protein F5X99DRAFT_402709 [Biscogniauxia marginata]|nr:hypothetical protein F5X99DRAFT_402709 [Biscogniauxia marginata]
MAYNQSNVPSSDELAALFSRNMTFQPQPFQPAPQEQPKPQSPEPEPITYSISQHYHHSAHIAHQNEPPAAAEPPRPSSEPPQSQQPSAELILSQHGVDPSALSASQLQLFKTADDPQKMRLIELWRICPPTNPQDNPAVAWTSTTVEQEELLAQLRYEQRLAAEEEQRNSVMSLDGTPLTPVQTMEGRWVATSSYVEPYMMSGYEELARREYEETARRQYEEAMTRPKDVYSHFGAAVGGPTYRPATDPVYNDNSWARQQQESMENQYGAFQQMGEMEL